MDERLEPETTEPNAEPPNAITGTGAVNPHVEIDYPDGRIAIVGPVPRSHLVPLEIMLRKLYERWLEFECHTEKLIKHRGAWALMQQVAALFPRLDTPGQTGFSIALLRSDKHAPQLEALFLGERQQTEQGTKFGSPKLLTLNVFIELETPDWRQPEEDEEPIPSCGDPDMDLLGSLSRAFDNSMADALLAYRTLNAGQIDRLMFAIAELHRDPAERQQEALSLDYLAWKADNPEVLDEALGIKFKIPEQHERQPAPVSELPRQS